MHPSMHIHTSCTGMRYSNLPKVLMLWWHKSMKCSIIKWVEGNKEEEGKQRPVIHYILEEGGGCAKRWRISEVQANTWFKSKTYYCVCVCVVFLCAYNMLLFSLGGLVVNSLFQYHQSLLERFLMYNKPRKAALCMFSDACVLIQLYWCRPAWVSDHQHEDRFLHFLYFSWNTFFYKVNRARMTRKNGEKKKLFILMFTFWAAQWLGG